MGRTVRLAVPLDVAVGPASGWPDGSRCGASRRGRVWDRRGERGTWPAVPAWDIGPPLAVLLRRTAPSRVPDRMPGYVAAAVHELPALDPSGPYLAVARAPGPAAWMEASVPVVEVYVPRWLHRLRHGTPRLLSCFALDRLDACLRTGRPAPVFFRPDDAPHLLVVLAPPP